MAQQLPWIIPNLDDTVSKKNTIEAQTSSQNIANQQQIDIAIQRGYEEGLQKAQAEYQKKLSDLCAAISQIEQMNVELDEQIQVLTKEVIIKIIKQISKAVLTEQDSLIVSLLDSAFESLNNYSGIVEITAGSALVEQIGSQLDGQAKVHIKCDNTMEPYGFTVDTGVNSFVFELEQMIDSICRESSNEQ